MARAMALRGTLVLLVVLVVGVLIGWALHGTPVLVEAEAPSERARINGVRFTSRFIEPAGTRDADPRLTALQRRIADQVAEGRRRDPTLRVSTYVRDLESGAWTGTDEERSYVPASLMKMGVLFHVLEQIEADPTFGSMVRRYPGPDAMPSPPNLVGEAARRGMVPGESYTIRELLERMLVSSDNHAKDLLLDGVAPRAVDSLLATLDVPAQLDAEGRAVMTARSYAALFRILYQSSYFSRRNSEDALELLSVADFRQGMRQGIPEGVEVASKYGIHFDARDLEAGQQLHECGIVYAPQGPFTLCIMTRSQLQPASALARLIADLTATTWEEMTRGRVASPS